MKTTTCRLRTEFFSQTERFFGWLSIDPKLVKSRSYISVVHMTIADQ